MRRRTKARRPTRTPRARGSAPAVPFTATAATRCRVCSAPLTVLVFRWPSGVVRGMAFLCNVDWMHAQ